VNFKPPYRVSFFTLGCWRVHGTLPNGENAVVCDTADREVAVTISIALDQWHRSEQAKLASAETDET